MQTLIAKTAVIKLKRFAIQTVIICSKIVLFSIK